MCLKNSRSRRDLQIGGSSNSDTAPHHCDLVKHMPTQWPSHIAQETSREQGTLACSVFTCWLSTTCEVVSASARSGCTPGLLSRSCRLGRSTLMTLEVRAVTVTHTHSSDRLATARGCRGRMGICSSNSSSSNSSSNK